MPVSDVEDKKRNAPEHIRARRVTKEGCTVISELGTNRSWFLKGMFQ